MIYVRRVGPYVIQKRWPCKRMIKYLLTLSVLTISIVIIFKALNVKLKFKWEDLMELPYERTEYGQKSPDLHKAPSITVPPGKCGLSQPCPEEDFAFSMSSGAANVISPKICFNGKILKAEGNTWGVGLNIAVINGQTGKLISADSFDMWGGDVEPLTEFLKSIKNGSLVFVASSDDPATRLNDEARTLLGQLGSSVISTLGFRDNWVFVGGKGIKNMKPLEKHIKNEKSVNKYDDWPEMLEMEGCIPRRQD